MDLGDLGGAEVLHEVAELFTGVGMADPAARAEHGVAVADVDPALAHAHDRALLL